MPKRLSLITLAVLASGCAAVPAGPPARGVTIPPQVLAACAEEGGCTLITEEELQAQLQAAFQAGAMAARKRGGQGL